MKRKPLIYLAGPYTPVSQNVNHATEMLGNMRRGITACAELLAEHDIVSFCPWLDYQLFLTSVGSTITAEQIKHYSLQVLLHCDAVLTLGKYTDSSGTMAEIREANRQKIPVFNNQNNLIDWYRKQCE